jgi:hypothetical protein
MASMAEGLNASDASSHRDTEVATRRDLTARVLSGIARPGITKL